MLLIDRKDLEEIRALKLRIDSREHQRDELKTKLIGLKATDYSIERVQTSMSTSDNKAEILDKIDEINNSLAESIYELSIKRIQAINAIKAVPGIHGSVLELRYVEGLSWRDIAKKTCYSEDRLYKIHRKALQML